MASPKDDEKKTHDTKDRHEIPITKRHPIEIYRVLPTQHSVAASTDQWVMFPGLQKTIKVEHDPIDAIITVHCHACCSTTSARVDVAVFIDGEVVGIDGHNTGTCGKRHGSGLSHSQHWVPMVAFASITLPPRKNEYVVDCRVMNAGDSAQTATCSGTAMFIQVFKAVAVVEWFDVSLDDNKYFNENLEYKLKIKGKTTAYALTVDKCNIWFFYADSNPGIKCISYKDKRSVNDQYIITRIQCSVRKST